MRFRAEQHLRRPIEIRAVREQGNRIDCRAFTIWWKMRTTAATSPAAEVAPIRKPLTTPPIAADARRVCVIASTAAVGNAVRRNRAKRRLRAVFRQQQNVVPAGCDLLLIARRAATDAQMPELELHFADACRRIEAKAGRP